MATNPAVNLKGFIKLFKKSGLKSTEKDFDPDFICIEKVTAK